MGYITQLNEFEKWRKNNINIDDNIENEDNYVDEISHQPLNQDYESIFRNATDLFGDDDNNNNDNINNNTDSIQQPPFINNNEMNEDMIIDNNNDDINNKREITEVYDKNIPISQSKRRKINENIWLLLQKHLTNVSNGNGSSI